MSSTITLAPVTETNGYAWVRQILDSATVRMAPVEYVAEHGAAAAEHVVRGYVPVEGVLHAVRDWQGWNAFWAAPEREQAWVDALVRGLRERGQVHACPMGACSEDQVSPWWTETCQVALERAQA